MVTAQSNLLSRKATDNLSDDSGYLGRESDRLPSECKSAELGIHQQHRSYEQGHKAAASSFHKSGRNKEDMKGIFLQYMYAFTAGHRLFN
jgi:hypothetical protein